MQISEDESGFLPEERRQQIVKILMAEGKVKVPNLAQRLKASVDTIRRDLKELENSGSLTRVHGGALPRSPATNSYRVRQSQNRLAKEAIAIEACKLIQPNQVVFIDGGTTALEVVRHLPIDIKLTIVTASPPVMAVAAQYPFVQAIMLGGTLDPVSMTVIGGNALETLRQIQADVCILGICSLDIEFGVTTIGYEESKIKSLMVQNASEVVAVTTADKLGTAAPFKVASIDHLTHIVTESSAPKDKIDRFIDVDIEVVLGSSEQNVNRKKR